MPLSFSDRSFLIAPIFIKDFSLQRLCICYLYMYNRMKNIYPKLYLCVSCRDFYISVFQLQLRMYLSFTARLTVEVLSRISSATCCIVMGCI